MAVTFFAVLPFIQVMVVFFTTAFTVGLGVGVGAGTSVTTGAGVEVGVGVGVGTTTTSWVNFTLIVGLEKVKPLAERRIKPSFSEMVVVTT
jgi:hypothetical protein